jgi:geranylgeranyl diphosphate synthase type II
MLTATNLIKMVNDYIAAMPYTREPAGLYDPIKYVLSMGGKRIRPVLMLLTYNMYKEHPERILSSAFAIETYHNYTLLHDDLMDHADMRRGKMTVHKKWNDNTAILSGDSMLVLAYQHMAECEPTKLKPVLDLFTETALEIGEGQQMDMDFENRNDVNEDEYIEMIRLKTSVLLACAIRIGAILADAPAEDAANLYKYGEQVGLAFQLQDDYLDVYGDSKIFGKKIGGDIVSNKKTYMLINALLRADESQRKQLNQWIERKDFDAGEKISAVTNLYDEIGIRGLCEERINFYFAQSLRYVDKVNIEESRKVELRKFVASLMNRKS